MIILIHAFVMACADCTACTELHVHLSQTCVTQFQLFQNPAAWLLTFTKFSTLRTLRSEDPSLFLHILVYTYTLLFILGIVLVALWSTLVN